MKLLTLLLLLVFLTGCKCGSQEEEVETFEETERRYIID